jgi:phage FluMu gp28-like protein
VAAPEAAEDIQERSWADKRAAARQQLPEALADAESLPSVLLRYQAQLLAATAHHNFVVVEKSRRIGMTWGVGADAVLTSGASRSAGGMDTLYIGYNLDMAREFIDVCAMWAKAFIPAASSVDEFLFKDQTDDGQDKDILAYRISFASGFEIVALTSKPRSLRGRQGYLIFDEAAFHDDLGEMLKAGMAFLIWGGRVLVISTHDGQDNPFNELIQEVRAEKQPGIVLQTTFDDAIKDGLYERIALVTGLPNTPEAKAEWIDGIYGFYGEAGDEELRVIPRASSGAYLAGATIEACMSAEHTVARLDCPPGFELRPMEERRAFVDAWLAEHVRDVLASFDPGLTTSMGEDFARTTDLSVLAFGQERRDMSVVIPLIIEMRNTPIEQQKQVITYCLDRIPIFRAAKFDATGNGLGLAEWAQEVWGHERIEAVSLSRTWYLENMPRLKQHFEDQTVALVNDTQIRDDLRALKLVRGVPQVPENSKKGRHGDAAIALAMLFAAIKVDVEIFEYYSSRAARSRYAMGIRGGDDPLGFEDDDDDDMPSGRFGRGAV